MIFVLIFAVIIAVCIGVAKANKYDENGFDEKGLHRNGTIYDDEGYSRLGYDKDGYDRHGYDKEGYNRRGFNKDGFDRNGFDEYGYDKNGYNAKGYDRQGYDKNGFDEYGYDGKGFDRKGYDVNGYNIFGYNKDGFDIKGYDIEGYDKFGYDANGYDKNGYDSEGYNVQGFDKNGFDLRGYDRNGYDKQGYDQNGYNSKGYNKQGFNSEGYDRTGFNREGLNKDGLDRNEHNRSDNTPPSNNGLHYKKKIQNFYDFGSIKIDLASPEKIRSWSYGEVTNEKSLHYKTLKPEPGGLFCEKIFGPTRDFECYCGKYRGIRYRGKICENCGVEVTRATVRRERMGTIELAVPICHIWYLDTICLLLDISISELKQVIYFSKYIVIDPARTSLKQNQILDEKQYWEAHIDYDGAFCAGMGAEAIKEILQGINIEQTCKELHAKLEKVSGKQRKQVLKRLEVFENFRISKNRPEWMILDVIPVIPADLRPMVPLDNGRFVTNYLNDLYRRIISCNERLRRLLEQGAPYIIANPQKASLQREVDVLIDNSRCYNPRKDINNRILWSLSDQLSERFRQNLRGKRVDYSGRSVVVPSSDLRINQCGLPREMALELFKPFVMVRLVKTKIATNIKSARRMVDRASIEVWNALETVIKEHLVFLNHPPTLQRNKIQAFEPVLVEGKAIKINPLIASTLGLEFGGDQIAVHVPLSEIAKSEASVLMGRGNNLINLSNGKIMIMPIASAILGLNYLTEINVNARGSNKVFRDKDEAILAYNNGSIELQAPIRVRFNKDGKSRLIWCSVGLIIVNEFIPQNLGFVNRGDEKYSFDLEWCFKLANEEKRFIETNDEIIQNTFDSKSIMKLLKRCQAVYGNEKTVELVENINRVGLDYCTKKGVSISIDDIVI